MKLVGYHGSHRRLVTKPEVFRDTLASDYGPGFYFASILADTSHHGPHVYKAGLELQKPLIVTGYPPVGEDAVAFTRLHRAFGISKEDIDSFGEDSLSGFFEAYRTLVQMGMYNYSQLGKWIAKIGYDSVLVQNHALVLRWKAEGNKNPPKGNYICVHRPDQIFSWEELPFGANDDRSPNYMGSLRGTKVW